MSPGTGQGAEGHFVGSFPSQKLLPAPGQTHHRLLALSLLRIRTKSMQTQRPDTLMPKGERGETQV